jgi:hypothetical protein
MFSSKRRLALVTIFSLWFVNTSFSQKREDLIGEWKIVKVELSPDAGPEEKQGLNFLSQVLLKSAFQFRENNTCTFSCSDPEMEIKDGAWQFDAGLKLIRVLEGKSKAKPGVLMEISVQEIKGKVTFLMKETPVILSVVKQ